MNTYFYAAMAAAAFAAATALVLIPLARRIPAQLELRWQQEVEEYVAQREGRHHEIHAGFPPLVIVGLGAALGFIALAAYGFNAEGVAACVFFFLLLLLLVINVKHALLPDIVVMPAMWAALLFHAVSGHAAEHVYGAAAAYAAPFLIMLIARRFTGAEVIGQGDMKAFAMAGAWFGLAALPIFFGAFLVSVVVCAILAKLVRGNAGLVPSGPAHVAASVALVLHGGAF